MGWSESDGRFAVVSACTQEWPWLSYTDSSSGGVSVFVCSVLPFWVKEQVSLVGWSDSSVAQRRMRPLLSLPYLTVIVVGRSSWEPTQVKLTVYLCLYQCVTAKAPVRSPPPRPSVTTVATGCRPASRCSSRCLREDWTTATVCCHLMPRWWVNTPGPSWPQIR